MFLRHNIPAPLAFWRLCAEEEARRAEGGNMFKKSAAEEKRSKIFAALNPQSLFYESAREKQENEEEKVEVGICEGVE